MVADEESLERISIEASLTDSGVSLNAKSRFVSAIDRLFGGVFSIPAAHLEARASRVRLLGELDRHEMRQKAELRLAGELKAEQLELAAQYLARERETKRMLNLATVARIALDDLRENDTQDGPDDNIEGEISEDWLNWFETYAEKATAEDLRRLWGKVLAGETRKPGSFSLSTLRVISETDQRLADLFQKHVRNIFDGKYVLKDNDGLKGENLLELTTLEDAGYLREVNGMLSLNWTFDQSGRFVYRSGNLIFVAEGPPGHAFQVGVILLSRAAQDLLAVLPGAAPGDSFRELASFMPEVTTSIKLGVVIDEPEPGRVSWTETDVLKPAVKAA